MVATRDLPPRTGGGSDDSGLKRRMCGICGAFRWAEGSIDRGDVQAVASMAALMERRGPDSQGAWNDARCALGFRRLSILDLSPDGSQPMLSEDGRYALVFNGEVYNFRELRADLEAGGARFRSSGDSAVVLQSLISRGREALGDFNGMFALAFYDSQEQTLLLARDHAGIKPLYFSTSSQGVIFGSQFDQILRHPWTRGQALDPEALHLYLRFGHVPAPRSMLQGARMLEAGNWVEFGPEGETARGAFFEYPRYRPVEYRGEEAQARVEEALEAAVRRHLVADVPVGVFLSGGIDSPLVAAEMGRISGAEHRAFTIALPGASLDESEDAARYAEEIGLSQRIEELRPEDGLEHFDEVLAACSEPTADYSIFPTYLVSKVAASEVKVVLSGDGGDEPFWGYPSRMGSVIRQGAYFRHGKPLRALALGARKIAGLGRATRDVLREDIGDLVLQKQSILSEDFVGQAFPSYRDTPVPPQFFDFQDTDADAIAQYVRWVEFCLHLPRVLKKVDRASMQNSLEVRVPLLDKEFLEVASRVDWESCYDPEENLGKIPLRKALRKQVKHHTVAKRGFSIPVADWLLGPLRDRFHDSVLARDSICDVPLGRDFLARAFQDLEGGNPRHAWSLWSVFSLQLWSETHLGARA